MTINKIFLGLIFFIFSQCCFSKNKTLTTSLPISCVQASFSSSGSEWWQTINLTLTNQCGSSIDFQNSTITFLDKTNLNTSFWFTSSSNISYPSNNLQITSQAQTSGNYLSTLALQFPTGPGSSSVLPGGESFTLTYGAPVADFVSNSVNVYLGTPPANTGEIDLMNTTGQPANVSQAYALINLVFNGQPVNSIQVPWSSTVKVTNLTAGNYTISPVNFSDTNGNAYEGAANPSAISLTAGSTVASSISYAMVPANGSIAFNVQALPSVISGYTYNPSVSLTNTNNGSTTNAVTNWNTTTAVPSLLSGASYTFTTPAITFNGYQCNPAFNPVSAIASISAPVVNLTYSCSPIPPAGSGRIIGYLPGWKTPPSANQLATAGYTHILVAFGVFSTTTPGQITPAFSTVSASYIKSLQNLGIKVLLSLGGASTSLPNTTVDFDQVLSAASSPTVFTQTFIQSLNSLITQYGFDGFDFDIESGLNAGGTFANPQGDIAALASIINTMSANHPGILLTMAPQTANVSATSGFSSVWGNYASLIMQTYNSLAWVGVQLYNSGCMLGINNVCYDPNNTTSPDFSVAMATDMLVNWPTASGFQPYISFLKPSQIVLGYLIPNAQGVGDGAPVIPVATIKRALHCLSTDVAGANSCDTYIPPKSFPGIGGVFGWEVTYDQSNNYQFATGLSCVKNGSC